MGTTYKTGELAALIQRCKADPQELTKFKALLTEYAAPCQASRRAGATYIKGIFRTNGLRLDGVNVDNHFNGSIKEDIDPITLRDTYNALSMAQRNLTNVLAYTGLRIHQLSLTRLDQIRPLNDDYYIIEYFRGADRFQNKESLAHYSIAPKTILDPLITRAKERGSTLLCDDAEKLTRDISDYASLTHKITLTAKYWRELFKTKAADAGCPPNIYNFLEGTTPKDGANALNYALANKLKFLRIYDELLAPYLAPLAQSAVLATTRKAATTDQEQLNRIESKLDKLLSLGATSA